MQCISLKGKVASDSDISGELSSLYRFVPPDDEMLARIQLRAGLWQLGSDGRFCPSMMFPCLPHTFTGPLKLCFPPEINRLDAAFQEVRLQKAIIMDLPSILVLVSLQCRYTSCSKPGESCISCHLYLC